MQSGGPFHSISSFVTTHEIFLNWEKYSNVTSDPSVKDVDFFLDVLEMFQTWLAATREQLAEQKVQNEAHINEITNMLSMNYRFFSHL